VATGQPRADPSAHFRILQSGFVGVPPPTRSSKLRLLHLPTGALDSVFTPGEHCPSRLALRAAAPALTGPALPVGSPAQAITIVRRMTYNGSMVSKTARLSLRLTPEQDAVLRKAAEARGESANEYVLRHAVEAAEIDLADRRVFVADDTQWNELQRLLSAPPALPSAMIKLLSNPSILERPE